MDILRDKFDRFYDLVKPVVFKMTARNPEIAHHLFANLLKGLRILGLDGLVLDNKTNYVKSSCDISNAAGFNKNGEIHPSVMKLLGFDRVVVGTVTYDSWKGNPKPNVRRFVKTSSLINWTGLPSIGAKKIARRFEKDGEHGVPLTVNLMSTPEKNGAEVLTDLKNTILTLRDIPYINRWELNISCPNTYRDDGKIDERAEYTKQLDGMLGVVKDNLRFGQDLYLKVSPDLDENSIDDIVNVGEKYDIDGYTIANTTTNHLPEYIENSSGKGGASGNAVYDISLKVQRYFADRVRENVKLIACGGINSAYRMAERCAIGNCSEVQIFTPLIFEGTGLLRKLRVGK